MEVDTGDLVRLDEDVMIDPVVEFPALSRLVDFGAEDSGHHVLDDRHDCGRMYDHEVDGIGRACGHYVSAGFLSGCGTIVQGNSGVEPSLGYSDEAESPVNCPTTRYCHSA